MADTYDEIVQNNPAIAPFMDYIEHIMSMQDDALTDSVINHLTAILEESLPQESREQTIQAIIKQFDAANMTREAALASLDDSIATLDKFIDELNPSPRKRIILQNTFDILKRMFYEAKERYHSYSFILNMTVGEGGHVPTYAHESDAAADLYAPETITIPAHSLGNKVDTKVCIALPERWVAHIAPRSSIGAKTPLRLSNELGVIDSSYRGPLIILFDNISDSDYTINAGDRIVQIWVTPSYTFKPNVVETLDETERGTGGFGSTGK